MHENYLYKGLMREYMGLSDAKAAIKAFERNVTSEQA